MVGFEIRDPRPYEASDENDIIATYAVDDVEYAVSQAASHDYIVTVSRYGCEAEYYNLGQSKADALTFILDGYKVD